MDLVINTKKTPELASIVPGVVWSVNKATKIYFRNFSPLSQRLNSTKIFSGEIQQKCYERFLKSPNKPQTYVITSHPDYAKALIFATHLVDTFISRYSSNKIVWYNLNRFSNTDQLDVAYRPSLIIVSTVYADINAYRKEQVRDIVSTFWNVPKLVVGTGTDPISLAADVLNIPANSIFYHEASQLVESKLKVI